MRVISFLLAVAILVLSSIPCSDAGGLAVDQYSGQVLSAKNPGHSNTPEHGHEDLCSPFCQCSCCAVACTIPGSILAANPVSSEAFKKVFASYLPMRPVGIAIPVWQPPQLV